MKAILSSRIHHYLARASIFLITVALIAGMVGCGGGGDGDGDGASYTLIVDLTAGGVVAVNNVPIPGRAMFIYDPGTVVSLDATPDVGYQFADWTGNVSTIANVTAAITTITMNGNYLITANFGLEIYDWYDLDAIRNSLDGHHTLMNDLNATSAGYTELASQTANSGKGWEPIGTYNATFTGTFDGQGYEIKDLFIDRPDKDYVGLFGYVAESGVIEDIGVVNVAVNGGNWTGGLVGGSSGAVCNSYSTGSVTGSELVGGLVGGSNGTVSNSYSTGNVTGTGTSIYLFVGGLVGGSSGAVSNSYSTGNVTGTGGGQSSAFGGLAGVNFGTVSHSYATGSVTGTGASNYTHVGGLVGYNSNGTVSNSYSTGNVTGSGHSFVGGLVGFNVDDGTVKNCYATGNVSGTWDVGGLVGYNFEGTVSDSYSAGSVSGNSSVGGLVGVNTGTVTNSFWDIQTSGQNTSAGGTGKNTTEMQNILTFSGATWNITTVGGLGERNPAYIWNIVDSVTYPFLSWQP